MSSGSTKNENTTERPLLESVGSDQGATRKAPAHRRVAPGCHESGAGGEDGVAGFQPSTMARNSSAELYRLSSCGHKSTADATVLKVGCVECAAWLTAEIYCGRIQPTSTALAGAGGTRGSFARCRVVCLAIGARNVKPLAHKQFPEPRNATGLNLVSAAAHYR
jgi:hypothetical protein